VCGVYVAFDEPRRRLRRGTLVCPEAVPFATLTVDVTVDIVISSVTVTISSAETSDNIIERSDNVLKMTRILISEREIRMHRSTKDGENKMNEYAK